MGRYFHVWRQIPWCLATFTVEKFHKNLTHTMIVLKILCVLYHDALISFWRCCSNWKNFFIWNNGKLFLLKLFFNITDPFQVLQRMSGDELNIVFYRILELWWKFKSIKLRGKLQLYQIKQNPFVSIHEFSSFKRNKKQLRFICIMWGVQEEVITWFCSLMHFFFNSQTLTIM